VIFLPPAALPGYAMTDFGLIGRVSLGVTGPRPGAPATTR
jgi:hypothetical protein